ncbi:hypothetical protein L1887_28431 [Cichorium endivia]|nr:hypothetical protein L1887_28431 [Cichorium endivia]
MAVVTAEFEVTSSLPAPTLFKAFNDFDTIAPKAEPETYKAVKIIQGDGGVGTIKSITYGDALPFTSSKHKVDFVDTTNFSFGYTIFEGDVLMGIIESGTHNLKFLPSADGGSVYKHSMVFKCKGDAKLSEDNVSQMKEGLKKTFKAIEAYAIAHSEAY